MKIRKFPVMKEFELKSDPDGEAVVVVRQAREGENTDREEMFGTVTRVYDMSDSFVDDVKIQTKENPLRTRRREAYLVLAEIRGVTDEEGNELFRSKDSVDGKSIRAAMSESEFNKVWNILPTEMVQEISECIYDVNPMWDRTRQGE